MGRPSSIPDMSELEQWLRAGVTPKEASERYAERGLRVSPSTIAVTRHRKGWPRVKMDHSDLIPWVIKFEHRNLWDHKMLLLESSRRQGKKLTAEQEKSLDSWKQRLKDEDAVVHYQYDSKDGWVWTYRRPGIDDDLIRQPSPADEDEGVVLRHSR